MLQLRQQFAQTGQCALEQAFNTQEIDQLFLEEIGHHPVVSQRSSEESELIWLGIRL